MTPIPPKDRYPHLDDEPLGSAGQTPGRHHHARPPFPRPICRGTTPENHCGHRSQLRQPYDEPLPISVEQHAPTLHILAAQLTGEIAVNRFIPHQPIRLREVRQQTYCSTANPASKPPDQQPQNPRIQTSEPSSIVAERDQRPNLSTIWAFLRA